MQAGDMLAQRNLYVGRMQEEVAVSRLNEKGSDFT